MPTETFIRCATTRLTCADEAGAEQLRGVLPGIEAQLPAQINALIPDALVAAGLPPGAAVAIRRLEVTVEINEDSPPDHVAEVWAQAVRDALVAQLSSAAAARREDDCLHPDEWHADMAVLVATARGEARPWWASDEGAAAILARWIAADPGRAAAMLVDLLLAVPTAAAIPALLSGSEANDLARELASRLHGRLADLAPEDGLAERTSGPPSRERPWHQTVSAEVIERLNRLPPEIAQLFAQAAHLVFAPAQASAAALGVGAARSGLVGPAVSALVDTAAPDTAAPAPAAAAQSGQPAGHTSEVAPGPSLPLAEVFGGGLLMLLRPLISLLPARDITPDRLGAIGLAVLRRCLEPLPATALRLALERDRDLLAVFAGAPLPDAPLGLMPADPAAEGWIDRLADLMPEPDWAPSALRRVYGGAEPFVQAPGRIRLARLVMRPGLLVRTPWSAELIWPLEAADLALRRAGWDLDPGWVPWIGRTIAFRFGDER